MCRVWGLGFRVSGLRHRVTSFGVLVFTGVGFWLQVAVPVGFWCTGIV